MFFKWRLKLRLTKGNLLFAATMGSLSLLTGIFLLSPVDFDYQKAIDHIGIPITFRSALLVVALGLASLGLYRKGYKAIGEYVGAFACVFVLMPLIGVFAGIPRNVNYLGLLLLFNGVTVGIFTASAFISITLLEYTQKWVVEKSEG